MIRGVRSLLGLVAALVLATCLPETGSEPAGSGGSGGGPNTPSLCPTPQASAVLTDETGQALADAYALHVPTPVEQKVLATWWVFVLAANETGAVDPALTTPDLHAEVVAITQRYVGLWEPCPGSAAASAPSAKPLLISGPESFTCDGNCIPSAFVLKESLSAVLEAIGGQTITPVKNLVSGLKELSEGIQGAKSLGKDLVGVIDALMNEQDSLTVLKTVSGLVVNAGAIAGAAVLLGATSPILSGIAAVGAAVGSLVVAAQIGDELANAWNLRKQCLAYQEEQCSACHCAVEVIDYYSSGQATDECVEWVGVGPSAFCFTISGSPFECCTCDNDAVLAFNDCASLLSFDPNATPTDYEQCCGEAAGTLNPKTEQAPSCPCEPPPP